MPIDFHAAQDRHYADACLLEKNGCTPNAGQLYGLAGECGLKSLLINLGHPHESDGDIKKSEFRKHINQLAGVIVEIETWLNGNNGAKYYPMLTTISKFSDWDVSHRYFEETAIPPSLANWKSAAEDVRKALDQVRIDRGLS